MGFCVEKTEKEPFIIWKDLFELIMNNQKNINGRTIYGPLLLVI